MTATARDVEQLWASVGVAPDLLSRTCLVWGLRVVGDGPLAKRLDVAGDAGDPLHLTEWDLRRSGPLQPVDGTRLLVCENPRVLEAVAEREVVGWTVVCTSGEPNLVVDRVLLELSAAGVELRYHGDLDWPGVAISNRVIARYGAAPWLMSAEDYLAAVSDSGPALGGVATDPAWDAELGRVMRECGRGVHEEAVLESLLAALTDDATDTTDRPPWGR